MTRLSAEHYRGGALIASWIAVTGGQPSAAVMAHFGMAEHTASRCLRAALADKLLAKVRYGQSLLWVLPADEKRLRDEQVKGRSARSAYSLALYHRRRAAGIIDSKGRVTDPEHWPVVQRIVPAAGARPIVTRAPNSVFALGAAA